MLLGGSCTSIICLMVKNWWGQNTSHFLSAGSSCSIHVLPKEVESSRHYTLWRILRIFVVLHLWIRFHVATRLLDSNCWSNSLCHFTRGGSASQQLPSVVDPATLYVFECAADWIDGKQLPNVVCGFVGQLQLWAKMAERILNCFLLVHCLENMQLPVQWLTWLIHSCFFPRLGSNSVSKRSARGASASHFLCSFVGNLFDDLFRSQTSLIYQFRRLQESGPLQRQNCLCSLIWFSWFCNYSAHLSTWFLWW